MTFFWLASWVFSSRWLHTFVSLVVVQYLLYPSRSHQIRRWWVWFLPRLNVFLWLIWSTISLLVLMLSRKLIGSLILNKHSNVPCRVNSLIHRLCKIIVSKYSSLYNFLQTFGLTHRCACPDGCPETPATTAATEQPTSRHSGTRKLNVHNTFSFWRQWETLTRQFLQYILRRLGKLYRPF